MNELEKKQIINNICKDKSIAKFIKDNKLSNEDILKNLNPLSQYKEQMAKCANCNGKCEADIEGLTCELNYNNGKVTIDYVDCNLFINNDDAFDLEVIDYTDNKLKIFDTVERTKLYLVLGEINKNLNDKNAMHKGLYLHGNYGTGKSLLMYEYAKKLSKNYKVIFAYYPDLVRRIQSSYGNSTEMEALILRLKKCDILFLDDIGRENNTGFIRDSILGPILQYRCDNNLPMFFTSNRNLKALESHLAYANNTNDTVKAKAIIARIKFLTNEYELVDKDFRNQTI